MEFCFHAYCGASNACRSGAGRISPRIAAISIGLIATHFIAGCASPDPARETTQNARPASVEAAPKTSENIERIQIALLPPLAPAIAPAAPVPAEKRFDLSVRNAPAREVFASLVEGTRQGLIVHPEVSGNITLDLRGVSIDEALRAIRDTYGYDYVAEGGRIVVHPAAIQSRIYQVNHADIGGRGDFWTQLGNNLRSIVGSGAGRDVAVNSATGVVAVRAHPGELRQVEGYLRTTGAILARQVVVEAQFVEVTLHDSRRAGIDWGAIPGATAGRLDGLDVLGFSSGAGDFDTALRAFATQGATRVISTLRITALNNQRAVLRLGEGGVPRGEARLDNTQRAGRRDPFAGVELVVTPHIAENAKVIFRVQPSVNAASTGGANATRSGPAARADSVIQSEDRAISILGGAANFGVSGESPAKELVILLRPTIVSGSVNATDMNSPASTPVVSGPVVR